MRPPWQTNGLTSFLLSFATFIAECRMTGPDACLVEPDMPDVFSSRVKMFVRDAEIWADRDASSNRHGASSYARAQ
jgi:hypothetical protein